MKLLYLFIVLSCVSCLSQPERNCNDFKTGTFEFKYLLNGKEHTSTFIRTEKLQVETYNNKTDSSSVRWINDCEAVFKTINPKNMTEQQDVHLKIIATTDSSYTFEYSFVGETKKQKGTAIKLK